MWLDEKTIPMCNLSSFLSAWSELIRPCGLCGQRAGWKLILKRSWGVAQDKLFQLYNFYEGSTIWEPVWGLRWRHTYEVRKLGLIEIGEGGMHGWSPPQASRVWNRWPWHSWEGRWGFHSKERDSGGTGGDLEQQGIDCKERGLRLNLTKNDFLAGELWLHQRGVRHQVRG